MIGRKTAAVRQMTHGIAKVWDGLSCTVGISSVNWDVKTKF
jgi:hypothetical protein